jgi:hypothetical protein
LQISVHRGQIGQHWRGLPPKRLPLNPEGRLAVERTPNEYRAIPIRVDKTGITAPATYWLLCPAPSEARHSVSGA